MDRDAKWLAWFEQQFSMMAGSDRQIDLEEFKHALNVKQVTYTHFSMKCSNLFNFFLTVFFPQLFFADTVVLSLVLIRMVVVLLV